MNKQTDLNSVKSVVKTFLYFDIEETELPPMLAVYHPIFENGNYFIPSKDNGFTVLDLMKDSDLQIAREYIEKRIDKLVDVFSVYLTVRKSYRMTFLKFAKPYLSKKDFSKLLADAWTSMEHPNADVNVPIKTSISWFKQADKKSLMNEDDYKFYQSLPQIVTVYRGVRKRGKPDGISWTLNRDTALWFSTRFGRRTEESTVWVAEVDKSCILAYFNDRNENEVIVDTSKIERRIL